MDHIETKILNSYTIQEAAQNMVFAARLTQQGHSIQNMDDLMALYQKSFTDKTVDRIASLPHPTVQKSAYRISDVIRNCVLWDFIMILPDMPFPML